jgi:hypothetical protein
MNNDRHGEPCARDVGARVDARSGASRTSRKSGADDAARHAKSCRNTGQEGPLLTREWSEHRAQVLRAFYRDAAVYATRYRISADDLLSHAHALCEPQIARGNYLKPVACIADLSVAAACCLGRANAWNELWIFAEPSMTRAAFSRLPETLALTWTRRYWTSLERRSRAGEGGLVRYDGSRPIRLWLVEDLLGTLERERAEGRLAIRREHIGRPIPLRLVGEQLA